MKRLGIVLATTNDLRHARAIALAARRARVEVALFAMDAGCRAFAAEPAVANELADADCELFACSSSSVGLAMPEQIVLGSQDDHAAVLARCDRVVALT